MVGKGAKMKTRPQQITASINEDIRALEYL